jgi:hypothetical protein
LSAQPETDDSSATAPFDSPALEEHRGSIDYAMRTVQQSLVQFSLMADAKANIMITVCSIVISVSITQLHRPNLTVPLLVLGVFTGISLVAALLCALPGYPSLPRDAAPGAGLNLLFFQHFRQIPVEEFERGLADQFETWGGVQRAIARDIHSAGSAIGASKYRMLRVSYIAFLIGLASSAATALAAYALQST